MAPTTTLYTSSIVSARSRRLRTIAAVLLVAVVLMSAYGILRIMPGVKHSVVAAGISHGVTSSGTGQHSSHTASNKLHVSAREARILRLNVLFAYAYWSVWLVLVLSLLLVIWMDIREVSRNYLANRRDLWTAAATLKAADKQRNLASAEDVGDSPDQDNKNQAGA